MGQEEVDEHKRTPAALPIMIGMSIMLLLAVIYCVWAWAKHSKQKRAARFSNRGRNSIGGKGKHQELAEDP